MKPAKTVDAMMREVTRRVKNATNGHQLPWTYGNLTEDFYFNESSNAPENPTPTPAYVAAPPSTPGPSPPPPASPLPNVQDFIRGTWQHYASNDSRDWAADFAPAVNYCYYDGAGPADRNFVQIDRAKFLNSYPTRHYNFYGLTIGMALDGNSARVQYAYRYSYNGKKVASGVAHVSLKIQLAFDTWSITDFDETVKRD